MVLCTPGGKGCPRDAGKGCGRGAERLPYRCPLSKRRASDRVCAGHAVNNVILSGACGGAAVPSGGYFIFQFSSHWNRTFHVSAWLHGRVSKRYSGGATNGNSRGADDNV